MDHSISDEVLMGRFVRTLDEEPFQELTRRYYGRAVAYARRLVFPEPAAEDAVQETFLRLVRFRNKYREGRAFRPWFYVMLRNACRDIQRKQCRYADKLDAYRDEWSPRKSDELPDDARDVLHRALGMLKERDREIVVLHYLEDMPYHEIATVLKCSTESAKKRAQRALARMRDTLEKSATPLSPASPGGRTVLKEENM